MTSALTLTMLGHSCVLLESSDEAGHGTRVLLDPGSLTPALESITDLHGVLVTHAHIDHIDPEQVKRLITRSPVRVYGDEDTSRVLEEAGLPAAVILAEGRIHIGALDIEVAKWPHEQIYPGIPVPGDLSYFIDGRLFAPGDSFAVPEFPVDVLLLPTGAPWMKLAEAIDYMRAVAPRVVIPVHDGGLDKPHREMHRTMMQKFAPSGTTVLRPEIGEAISL